MFKKVMVTIAAVGLLLGNLQAKSLRDVLGDKLDGTHRGTTKLDLSVKELTEITPTEAKLLARNYPNLKELSLSFNNLPSLPEGIWELKNLKDLSLSFNNLTHLPERIGKLKNLKQLKLNYNELTHLPKEIGKLAKLEMLDLSGNNLTDLPEGIGELTNLEYLYLDQNRLTLEEIKRIKELLPDTKISAANQKVLKANLMRRSPRELRRRQRSA